MTRRERKLPFLPVKPYWMGFFTQVLIIFLLSLNFSYWFANDCSERKSDFKDSIGDFEVFVIA